MVRPILPARRPARPVLARPPRAEARPAGPSRRPAHFQAAEQGSGSAGLPKPRRALPKLSLAQVRDPQMHVLGLRPALVETRGSELEPRLRALAERTRPEALARSPLASDTVTCVHGRDLAGRPLSLHRNTLGALLAPYLARPQDYGEGGATTYLPVMINHDRPQVPEFADFFPPTEPWHDYCLGPEPDLFPRDLLEGTGAAPPRRANTSIILGLGTGVGQPFHWHGANVFAQLHGAEKWSIFPNSELYAFFDPAQSYRRRQPCPIAPAYESLFADTWWHGPRSMPWPTEVVTRPGDVLVLPTGTWHATWNLTAYTFGVTQVLDV